MLYPVLAGLGGLQLQTVLLALVVLAVGVLVARIVLSVAWKLIVIGIFVLGAIYAAGVLL